MDDDKVCQFFETQCTTTTTNRI